MITIVNKVPSVVVSRDQAVMMTRACAYQLRYHLCPAWGARLIPVVYADDEHNAPPGSWVIGIFHNDDQATGALGWHVDDENNVKYGRVFTDPILDNGGSVLTGALSVSAVLSHEVCEIAIDPTCALKVERGQLNGVTTDIALEVCDPVESDGYALNISNQPVWMSNFVTPAWFDAGSPGPWDYMHLTRGPFQLSRGGYQIIYRNGQAKAEFAAAYPDWKREIKRSELARSARRINVEEAMA